MKEALRQQVLQVCEGTRFDEPMSRHTSIRIGGPADALVYPKTIDELAAVVRLAAQAKLPVFALGAGSNLLVRDQGIRGVVVSLSEGFTKVEVEGEQDGRVVVYAEAGVGLPRLVDFTAEEGLSGLEAVSGIPGNVGGGLVMNAGTHEGDLSQTVISVTFLDKEGRLTTWPKDKIRYGYRESHFPRGAIVLSARFGLARMASELVRGRIQKHRAYRLETQPLNVPNIGSVFKNHEEGKKKMFAAKMIEEAGLKDVRVGGARISAKHANWIVNEGGATAKDVLALIGLMKDKVKEKFGITMETEVRVVGEE
ncbi:MAG TPA: UDP-N-acetylmuramate dehydrogenase [bacterium]|nr:UDP-N-acetylmuramate dehydrogenase [bacterium]